jgi:hypothetical protein
MLSPVSTNSNGTPPAELGSAGGLQRTPSDSLVAHCVVFFCPEFLHLSARFGRDYMHVIDNFCRRMAVMDQFLQMVERFIGIHIPCYQQAALGCRICPELNAAERESSCTFGCSKGMCWSTARIFAIRTRDGRIPKIIKAMIEQTQIGVAAPWPCANSRGLVLTD